MPQIFPPTGIVDPTLPKNIKPILYNKDEYQLYDYYFEDNVPFFMFADNGDVNGDTIPNLNLLYPLPLTGYSDGTRSYNWGLFIMHPGTHELIQSPLQGFAKYYTITENNNILDANIVIDPAAPFISNYQIYAVDALVQRFSPFNYPWAENWISDVLLYSKIKEFYIRSVRITDPLGVYFLKESADANSANNFFDNPAIIPKNFQLRFNHNKTELMTITWLYKDKVNLNQTNCISRRSIVVTAVAGLNQISLPTLSRDEVLHASVVCSSVVLERAFEVQGLNHLLYKNFTSVGSMLSLKKLDEIKLRSNKYSVGGNTYTWGSWEKLTIDMSSAQRIIFANNNYWNNGSIKADILGSFTPFLFGQINTLVHPLNESLNEGKYYQSNSDGTYGEDMPDSVRVMEMHDFLGCGERAVDTAGGSNPVNLWYGLNRILRVLGISIDPKDRSIRSIRQRAKIPPGQPIPAGWNFGQWGENSGDDYQKGTGTSTPVGMRDGIAIESIPNQLEPDPFNPGQFKIVNGGYVLCENIPQLLAEILDQFDAALGLQESGAFALPDSSGTKQSQFEGMHSLLAEVMHTSSRISQNATQTQISSLITQAIVKEILSACGQPVVTKTLAIDTGDAKPSEAFYPGLAVDAPTLLKILTWVLQNLAILVGQKVKE